MNNSANKNGWAPSLKIGLSQPIKLPSHNIPQMYIMLIENDNLQKLINRFLL